MINRLSIGLGLAAGVVWMSSTASGAFTITHGDATFSSALTPFLPDSTLSTADFRPDGGATTDHLFYYNWSYRVNGVGGNRGFSFLDTPIQTVSGNTVTFAYSNAGPGPLGQNRFDALLTIKLTDGGVPGAALLESTLVFTADQANATSVSFDVFHGTDFDLAGTAGTDTYSVVNPLGVDATVTDGATTLASRGAGATAYQVGTSAGIRALLTGGGANNLNNTATFGPGDGAIAYQWSLGLLAPGESRTLYSAFAVNMAIPAPGAAALFGVAALIGGRRRR